MSELPNSEVAILNAVLELPAGHRAAYLDQACAGDSALRQQVEALLQAHDQAEGFLEAPPAGLDFQRIVQVNIPPTEKTGDKIGRYKLLQEIGEGGCGVVYMAEQEEPVRRRVALKVIKLGMDTKQVIARFEAERQALALMDHPNIAKVLDAGATDAGRPYFVMELVRGVKITDYCDQANLSTRDRLDLFIKVCQAIQHAHQKGIIHRDIKPSNILVTLHDGVPVPKVIDFGIAKATTDQRLTDKTLFTALEQFIGTPAYMSPEQAEMSGLDIDTRCDIYSLGVLLYELLTGKTPFDAQELMASGLDAMRKTIREQEPLRPSTKLSQTLVAADKVGRVTARAPLGVPPSGGSNRVNAGLQTADGAQGVTRPTPKTEEEIRASSRRLLRIKETITLLRGDVDWIVMKCLEKDRARRYETANGLASDIQRHLSNEAVLARPPSAAYRFQKMVRRNKLAFAATAAIATVLVLGVIASTWQAVRATQAKREAVEAQRKEAEQRQSAENNAREARQAEQKADAATSLAKQRAAEITRNLYFAEMNLAGDAAAEAGGISRIATLTAKWLPEKGAADQRGWEWYYLRSLLQELFTLSGYSNSVNSVAWSPDGKRLASGSGDNLASGSGDNTIKVWDAASRQVIHTLRGHTGYLFSVAWSPDGKRLASASGDATVRVWDADSGHETLTLSGHSGGVHSVAWSRDGKLASAGDNTVKVWDAANGTNVLTFTNHTDRVDAMAWSPDGKRLASGSWDNTVKVWEADSGKVIHTLTNHTYWVRSVAWSPDGKRLASASGDRKLMVWDAASGTLIHTLTGHTAMMRSVAWSPNGKRLASAGHDYTLRIWDAESGANLASLTKRGHTFWATSVAWSPDGKRLASGSRDKTVRVWEVDSEENMTLRAPASLDTAPSIAWSLDGKRLATASADKTVRIWDAASGSNTFILTHHTDRVQSVAWSPDGKHLASASWDQMIKIWEADSGKVIHTLTGHTYRVWSVAWSPDGKRLASAAPDSTVRIWDWTSERLLHTLEGYGNGVHSVAWSPNGKSLASASWDGSLKVWVPDAFDPDKVPPQLTLNLRGENPWMLSAKWSPDGKRVAAGNGDTLKVWDVASGTNIHTLRGHSGDVISVSWSSDGKRLASASQDNTVKVWDADSGEQILTLRGFVGYSTVAWSPDGKRLAASNGDGTVKILDAGKGYALERK